jgi:DNA-binding CsgD family transcriptional regulator
MQQRTDSNAAVVKVAVDVAAVAGPAPVSGGGATPCRLRLGPDVDGVVDALVTSGRLCVTAVDADGVYLYMSPAMEAYIRRPAGDFVGRSMVDTMTPPAGAERLALVQRALGDAADGRPTLIVESIAGVPLRTILMKMIDYQGRPIAVCVHHFGAAAIEVELDPVRYNLVTPSTSELTPLSRLTSRELEVLRLIAMGDSQAEIARKIHRTVKTVEWHRASLGKKLGATSRVELARMAIHFGLVRTDATADATEEPAGGAEPLTDECAEPTDGVSLPSSQTELK